MTKVQLKNFLLEETGGSTRQAMDALEDGELLGELGVSQETAEELHAELKSEIEVITFPFPFPFPGVQQEIFGRRYNNEFGVHVLNVEDGSPVTRIPGATTVYPLGAFLSCDWEHPEGIVLHPESAQALGIEVE